MRRVLIIFAVAAVAVAGTAGALSLASFLVRGESRTEVSFTGIEVIVLDLDAGGIELEAALPGGASSVSGTRTVHTGLQEPELTERVEGTTLYLENDCSWFTGFCGVSYELTVPVDVEVRGGSGGGGVTLSGLSGDIQVSSSGGGIDATDMAGDLVLSSSGGGINLERPTGTVELSSSGGGVTIKDGRSPRVTAESSGGGVRVELSQAADLVEVDSSGGGVTVVVPDDGAGYAVDASSSGGDTDIDVATDDFAERHIRATSSGGGVRIAYP